MLNYGCRKGRAYLKYEFIFNVIKNIHKKICRLRNLFLTYILSLALGGGFRRRKFSTYTGIRTYALPISLPT